MPIFLPDAEFADLVSKSLNLSDLIRKMDRPISGAAFSCVKNRIKRLGLQTDHFASRSNKKSGNWRGRGLDPEIILVFNRTGKKERITILKRAFLLTGQKEICVVCGIPNVWNGKPLTLHIDHIDGNPLNNVVNNLRFLCPNCHTQTETHGHRNIKRPTNPHAGKSRPTTKQVKERIKKQHHVTVTCTNCNAPFDMLKNRFDRARNAAYCSRVCYDSHRAKNGKGVWPDSIELAALISTNSIMEVARKIGVSDTAVRKRCKRLGILR